MRRAFLRCSRRSGSGLSPGMNHAAVEPVFNHSFKKEPSMFKKLIPAAALLALAGAAQAQVTVYGLIDAAVQKTEGAQPTLVFGGNSTTRLGVKGSQDLGSGVKGNFQLEAGLDINGKSSSPDDNDNSQSPFLNRQAWGGFSGDFGEVRVGRQDSVIFQTMIGFDLNGATNTACAQCAAQIAGGLLGGKGTRSLQYIAPAMGGLKVQFGYQADEPSVAGSKASAAAAATYTMGSLTVAAAFESKQTATGDRTNAVGGSYDFGVAKVALNYSTTPGAEGSMVGVVVPVGGMNVGLQVASNTENSAKGAELFVNKEILKNTVVYAEYLNGRTYDSSNVLQKNRAYAVGVIYAF